jgi:penicillin amidase
LTLDDLARFQTDNTSLSAIEIIPYLRGLAFSQPQMETARNTLLNWDGSMTLESPEAALFNIFWAHLLREIYVDDLPEDLLPTGESYSSDYVAALLPQPEAGWWDDRRTPNIRENREDILVRAFELAYLEGVDTFGENLAEWRWGDLHTITFSNVTLGQSGITLIENLFNRGPFPTHGSESVPQKTCWSTNSPYAVRCIPALRQVIDLGDLSNSRMIQSVGQSGHPFSAHYGDFIESWRDLQYHPSNWSRGEAEAGQSDTLVLEPAP